MGPIDVLKGNSRPSDPFWMESIAHQGIAAFNQNPSSYQVFRNVKDFGASGDGRTDDTKAINAAISHGNRCGNGNGDSTTIAPAVVYFPSGTYLVSAPIIAWYYSQLIGDAKRPPILLASHDFQGIAVIDADPYIEGGNGRQWYINQNNFFRSVRNFVIDVTRMPPMAYGTGLHWQVSQATSLMNITVNMSTHPSSAHQGIFMENGSGGFMGDLIFNGGKYGIWVGNQQFTVRNITVSNARTAIYAHWNWGWTFQGVQINNCQVGFELRTGGTTSANQTVGAEAIIDAVARDTAVFLRTTEPSKGVLSGSIVLNNIKLQNVPTAVGVGDGTIVLAGGTKVIEHWICGNVYSGKSSWGQFVQDHQPPPKKAKSLLDSEGRIFGRVRPQYEDFAVDQFVSVRSLGARGDGKTDDTRVIQKILIEYAGRKIVFFDHGTYLVTSTIMIPAGTRMVGEVWSVILGAGPSFGDMENARPVVRTGETGSVGVLEITDIIFATRAPAAGAIVVEWNVRDPPSQQGVAGMWDTHIRLGGAYGTNLDARLCKGASEDKRMACHLALHLTQHSSAYLEGTWVWLADHSLDPPFDQISIFSGRGILSQSAGPVWMVGTAEHHVLYQYNLVNAKDHYMGLIQTETPYFQPDPPPPLPFRYSTSFSDPVYGPSQKMSWAVYVRRSKDILIFGAGLYCFFQHYTQACLDTRDCQSQIIDIDKESTVSVYSLSTVASEFQLSIDGKDIAHESENRNGFQSTVSAWIPG